MSANAEALIRARNRGLDRIAALDRAEARLYARRVDVLCAQARLTRASTERAGVEEFLALELAGERRTGQGAASTAVANAERMSTALPVTLRLLSEGLLYVAQAKVMLEVTAHCDEAVTLEVDRRLLPECATLGTVDLRRRAKLMVAAVESELDPEAVERRLEAARAERRTWSRAEQDGMMFLGGLVSAEQGRAFVVGLDRLAAQDRAADFACGATRRSKDQIRADLLAALPGLVLEARAAGSATPARPPRIVINVHIPMTTLLDLDTSPGYLEGYGPVSSAHVMTLLPSAELRRVAVDQRTGRPLDADGRTVPPATGPTETRRQLVDMLQPWVVVDAPEPGHDPSARLARFVDLRDLHCCGPGCSVPAGQTQRDHLLAWPAGPTTAWNLGLKSARCHRARHSSWQVTYHEDGSATWVGSLGREYTRPAPYLPPPGIASDAQLRPPRPFPTPREARPDPPEDCPF